MDGTRRAPPGTREERRCWFSSRKKNESIIINDNITVTVIEIRGDKVRLGIEAPKDVTVHRREVSEAIQNQSRSHEPGTKVPTSES